MQDHDTIVKTVRDQYAAVARSGLSNDSKAVRSVAAAFGYSEEELTALPAEANMGLSCGNPVALASLKPGELVVDLGCGGGMDVLLASRQVGPAGKAIGIDMTADMLERARTGAVKVGATNVEFHQAQIDSLPLPDASVDCIISNCVINLAPDKDAVFREMLRVLKPGGRVAISDIALKQPLPEKVRSNIEAYVGCVAGAILIDEYQRRLQEAGFESVVVTDSGADLNAYAQAGQGSGCCGSSIKPRPEPKPVTVGCCGSGVGSTLHQGDALTVLSGGCTSTPHAAAGLHDQLADIFSRFDANAYAASVRVHAVKER
ncbi:MAG: arsenite methyltransferase [Planctomycetaceae bacterium]